MLNFLIKSSIILSSFVVLTSCTSKDHLKALLTENPDILIEALQKNPEKYAPVFNQVADKGRALMQARSREMDLAQREQDFKNPKQPEIDTAKRAIRGKANAPITIVAYSDFQCPYCSKAEATMEELRKKYGDKIRYVFKNFPLPFHQFAMPASQRYEAIAMQNKEKALRFHDEVFKHQDELNKDKEAFLDRVAAKVGADVARMKKDMVSDAIKNRINADTEEGKKFGVQGTPAFCINGVIVKGNQAIATFEEVIQRHLNEKSREVGSVKK